MAFPGFFEAFASRIPTAHMLKDSRYCNPRLAREIRTPPWPWPRVRLWPEPPL